MSGKDAGQGMCRAVSAVERREKRMIDKLPAPKGRSGLRAGVRRVLGIFFMGLGCLAVMPAGLPPATAEEAPDWTARGLAPCHVKGVSRRAFCGHVTVPLDYAMPSDADGNTIDIFVALLPAQATSRRGDPFVLLAGGPGQAASDMGVLAARAFDNIWRRRDILLIDQRGTGRSHPVKCGMPDGAPDMEAAVAAVAACRADADVDVSHFTLEADIHDMDRVRDALGYETLNLWGVSYGTRTAALYYRRYGSRVRSLVLDGVAPPDLPLFLTAPAAAERAKRKLAEACAEQPACADTFGDLNAAIDRLVDRARAGELSFDGIDPLSGAPLAFTMTEMIAVEAVRSVLYQPDAAVTLPFAVTEADRGNLLPLIAGLMAGAGLADSMYLGATLGILCGEEVARTGADAARAAGRDSFAGDTYYRTWKAYCDVWDYRIPGRDLPGDIGAPIGGDVPALILSGELDPITPPGQGDHMARGFPNSRHIVVPAAGHNTSHMACMPDLIADFLETLDAAALDTACLDHLARLPMVVGLNGQTRLRDADADGGGSRSAETEAHATETRP